MLTKYKINIVIPAINLTNKFTNKEIKLKIYLILFFIKSNMMLKNIKTFLTPQYFNQINHQVKQISTNLSSFFSFYNTPSKNCCDFKKMQKHTRKTRRAKYAVMKYPCIPVWMKQKEKDPFDYPLRSHKEIAFEQTLNPPTFCVKVVVNNYTAITQFSSLNVHKADKRNQEVTIIGDIHNMNLTPLQQKRLIFLLGPRWKGDGRVKIVSRQYNKLGDNLARGFDIYRQLYWEAKRAPMYIWSRMNNSERRAAARKLFGKNIPIEKLKQLKEEYSKKAEKAKIEFDNIYDNGNYTPKFIKDNLQRYLDANQQEESLQKEQEHIRMTQATKKAEETLARENIEKSLVKKRILSKKAYETFYGSYNEENEQGDGTGNNTESGIIDQNNVHEKIIENVKNNF